MRFPLLLIFGTLPIFANHVYSDSNLVNFKKNNVLIEKNEFPILHHLKYSIPYTFNECVKDLKFIMSTLLDDVNKSNVRNVNDNSANNGINKSFMKANDVFENKLEYILTDFAHQVIEICSPDKINEMLEEFMGEVISGNYFYVCNLYFNQNYLENDYLAIDDCFEQFLNIQQNLESKKMLKSKLTNLDNEKEIKDKRNDSNKFEKFSGASLMSNNKKFKNLNNSKKVSSKIGKIDDRVQNKISKAAAKIKPDDITLYVTKTETELSVKTDTLMRTLYKVTNKPIIMHDTITTTVISSTTDIEIDCVTKTETSISTTTLSETLSITNILVEISYTTTTVGKKTFLEKKTETETETKTITFTDVPSTDNVLDILGNLNGESAAEANRYLPWNSVVTETVTVYTATETVSRLPIATRLCDIITKFGLRCPGASSSSGPNMNININHNKGVVKIVNGKTITQNITFVTSTTATTITTKKKAKTKTKTKTDDCDDDIDDFFYYVVTDGLGNEINAAGNKLNGTTIFHSSGKRLNVTWTSTSFINIYGNESFQHYQNGTIEHLYDNSSIGFKSFKEIVLSFFIPTLILAIFFI